MVCGRFSISTTRSRVNETVGDRDGTGTNMNEKKKRKREPFILEKVVPNFQVDEFASKAADKICETIDAERKRNRLPPLT